MSLQNLYIHRKSIDHPPFSPFDIIYNNFYLGSHSTTVTLSTSEGTGNIYPTTHYNVLWEIWYYSYDNKNDDDFNYKYIKSSETVTNTTKSYIADTKGKTYTNWFFEASVVEVKIFISYNLNGGTNRIGGSEEKIHYSHNDAFTLPTNITKTGHTLSGFEGPFSGSGIVLPRTVQYIRVRKAPTIYAKWTINQYTVTYLSTPDHFDFTSTPNSYDYNTPLTATTIAIPIPRVIGEVYSFEKWTYNGSDLGERRLPTNDINLVANWTSTDKDEIQMSELSSVFDHSSSFQNIKISNYFDRLKLYESSERENVDFFSKLKGRGTF